jgi:Ca2+-binding EF-hand superfamily protein
MGLAEVRQMKEVFDIFDSDKSGAVSIREMGEVILGLGLKEEAGVVLQVMQAQLVRDGAEELSFAGFMEMFGMNKSGTGNNEENLRRLFGLYDSAGKGFIDYEDYRRVCNNLCETYSENETQAIFKAADKDRDGRLRFEEFSRVMTKEFKSSF